MDGKVKPSSWRSSNRLVLGLQLSRHFLSGTWLWSSKMGSPPDDKSSTGIGSLDHMDIKFPPPAEVIWCANDTYIWGKLEFERGKPEG
jgi:hypothetical protein